MNRTTISKKEIFQAKQHTFKQVGVFLEEDLSAQASI